MYLEADDAFATCVPAVTGDVSALRASAARCSQVWRACTWPHACSTRWGLATATPTVLTGNEAFSVSVISIISNVAALLVTFSKVLLVVKQFFQRRGHALPGPCAQANEAQVLKTEAAFPHGPSLAASGAQGSGSLLRCQCWNFTVFYPQWKPYYSLGLNRT